MVRLSQPQGTKHKSFKNRFWFCVVLGLISQIITSTIRFCQNKNQIIFDQKSFLSKLDFKNSIYGILNLSICSKDFKSSS